MRNYGNSEGTFGINDLNSYRSGRERSRLDDISSSAHNRESYGGRDHDTSYGSNYGNKTNYGSQHHQGSSPYSSSQAGWNNESNNGNRNQNQGSWSNQNQGGWSNQNRNSWQPSSNQGSSYNTGNQGSYGRTEDRDLFDRAGDAMERTGNRISNAWDRWTDDDNRTNRNTGWGAGSNVNRYGTGTSNYGSSNYGTSNYGSGGYGSSNYGSGSYGSSNYGSSNRGTNYDQDRYNTRRSTNDYERENDRGFFERVGDRISNAWDHVTGEEEDRNYNTGNRWSDSDRNRWSDNDRNRTSRGSSSYGPPYSYGSSSERDYQW